MKDVRKKRFNARKTKKRNGELFAMLSKSHSNLADMSRRILVSYNSLYVRAYGEYEWKSGMIAAIKKSYNLSDEETCDIFFA